jgi:hypothetical protein
VTLREVTEMPSCWRHFNFPTYLDLLMQSACFNDLAPSKSVCMCYFQLLVMTLFARQCVCVCVNFCYVTSNITPMWFSDGVKKLIHCVEPKRYKSL